MGQASARSRRARVAIPLLCSAVLASGCALLIPPSWRGHAPVPLAGPIDPAQQEGSAPLPVGDLGALSDARLEALVAADHQRLVEIASQRGAGPLADASSEAELRAIAARLPRLQRELARRSGNAAGERIVR